MPTPAITGTGVFTPEQTISNAELVVAFNAYVDKFNTEHAGAIAEETVTDNEPCREEFVV